MLQFTPTAPFAHTSGARNAKIALVGEAWGATEDQFGRPFVGASGQELNRMLRDAGLSRDECFLTNVFNVRPLANKIVSLCGTKTEVGKDYPAKAIIPGKYILPEYLPEVERLREELEVVSPNLIIALGNVACWALLGTSGITSLRGVISPSTLIPRLKVMPTFHPSAVLQKWENRVIVVADFMKAKKEKNFPEIIRPEREYLIQPTIEEMLWWKEKYALPASHLAVDIETFRGHIDMIGFASSPQHAMAVQFFSKANLTSTFHSPEEEVEARKIVQELLALPCAKIFQNGLYDMRYLAHEGFFVRNPREDTMLLHHSLYPELPKGLGFLASIYTNEAAWKLLNKGKTQKKDD